MDGNGSGATKKLTATKAKNKNAAQILNIPQSLRVFQIICNKGKMFTIPRCP